MKPIISPVGDCAISIDFGQVIDPKINRHIRQTDRASIEEPESRGHY